VEQQLKSVYTEKSQREGSPVDITISELAARQSIMQLTGFQLPTNKVLLERIRFCMRVFSKHVQEVFQYVVWELIRPIFPLKHGWIGNLEGCKFRDVQLRKRFRKLLEQLSDGVGESIPLVCQD